jgi:hypothetical protein
MSTPANPPPADPGNELLCEVPAQQTVTPVGTPAGVRVMLTIRTTSATVSVILQKADALTWAQNLRQRAEQLSDAGLIVPGNGRPPGSTSRPKV